MIGTVPEHAAIERDLPVEKMRLWALREGNRKRPIYELHKWWARRLGTTFRMLLLGATTPADQADDLLSLFLQKQDLSGLTVLDPFMGGGTSLVEAAKCGANVIGVDIDPVACFITRKELEGVTPVAIRDAYDAVARSVRAKVLERYRTTCPDGQQGHAIYSFWVDELTCPDCGAEVVGHPHYQLRRDTRHDRQTVICCGCGELADVPLSRKTFNCRACEARTIIASGPIAAGRLNCPDCGRQARFSELSSEGSPPRHRLFALDVVTEDGTRFFKAATDEDRRLYDSSAREWERRAQTDPIVPKNEIPREARYDNRPLIYGYTRYRDLFNARQLLCLSDVAQAIKQVADKAARDFLLLAFSDCLASNNMFCSFAFDYRKLTPLFGLHAYRRVVRPVENNVWGLDEGRGTFSKCVEKVIRGKEYALRPYEFRYHRGKPVSVATGDSIAVTFADSVEGTARSRGRVINGSAENLSQIKDESVDLVLSDPPYYDNLPYSELSDFYHVWLRSMLDDYPGADREHTPWLESLFVGRKGTERPLEHSAFVETLARAFNECARVLRRSGLLVFTYHHGDAKGWQGLGEALLRSPFVVTNVLPVRSEGSSAFHSYEGSLKWDAVLVCRKRDRFPKVPSRSALKRFVEGRVGYWKNRLKRRVRRPDLESLRRAFAVHYLTRFAQTPRREALLAEELARED